MKHIKEVAMLREENAKLHHSVMVSAMMGLFTGVLIGVGANAMPIWLVQILGLGSCFALLFLVFESYRGYMRAKM